MEANESQPRARYECGQALHELGRRHHDMGGAVLVRAFELQHDINGAAKFESFVGNSGAGDVAAQLFEFVALIHGAAHLGVEAEPLFVGTALLRGLALVAGNGLQGQHFLTRPGPERDAVGAGGRLQGRHGGIRIGLGHVNHGVFFNEIASTCQPLHDPFDDLIEQDLQLFGGRRAYGKEYRRIPGGAKDSSDRFFSATG